MEPIITALNTRDASGIFPLNLALLYGQWQLSEFLLKNGAIYPISLNQTECPDLTKMKPVCQQY